MHRAGVVGLGQNGRVLTLNDIRLRTATTSFGCAYVTSARADHISVTIAAMLGIEPPLGAEGRVLHEALKTAPDRK